MRRFTDLAPLAAFVALTGCREAPPTLTSPAPGARVSGEQLVPVVSAEGDYVVVFDGQGFGRGPVPLTPVADGPHRLALRDRRGQTFDEREIVVDRTPPALRLLRPAPVAPFGVATGEPVAVEVEVADAGPVGAVLANGVPLAPGPHGRFHGALPLPADGPLVVSVTATDAAGNRAEVKVESTPGLVRWQTAMPVEPGAWSARRLSDDTVLIALGEAAVAIGSDGRERFSIETPGHVLVEALDLPDATVLLRLLHPVTPSAAEVRFVDLAGKAIAWNRPDAVPLALAAVGDSPFVAWRAGDAAEGGRAPLPWPPATFAPRRLPFEPHRLVPWRDHLVAVGATRLAVLDASGEAGFQMDVAPGARALPSGDTLYVTDSTGLHIVDGPGAREARHVLAQPVTHACALPPNGLAYVFGEQNEVRRAPDVAPERGPVLPPAATFTDDDCLAFRGTNAVPLPSDLPPLAASANILGARRVGSRVLAVLDTQPPRASVMSTAASAVEVPLDGLANVLRVVSLPDGLLVAGLSAVRPDKGVLLRLALQEPAGESPPAPVPEKTP